MAHRSYSSSRAKQKSPLLQVKAPNSHCVIVRIENYLAIGRFAFFQAAKPPASDLTLV
jgi:hypothetical protein